MSYFSLSLSLSLFYLFIYFILFYFFMYSNLTSNTKSHIESYSTHLLPYKPEVEGVVYHQLLQKYPKEYAKIL